MGRLHDYHFFSGLGQPVPGGQGSLAKGCDPLGRGASLVGVAVASANLALYLGEGLEFRPSRNDSSPLSRLNGARLCRRVVGDHAFLPKDFGKGPGVGINLRKVGVHYFNYREELTVGPREDLTI